MTGPRATTVNIGLTVGCNSVSRKLFLLCAGSNPFSWIFFFSFLFYTLSFNNICTIVKTSDIINQTRGEEKEEEDLYKICDWLLIVVYNIFIQSFFFSEWRFYDFISFHRLHSIRIWWVNFKCFPQCRQNRQNDKDFSKARGRIRKIFSYFSTIACVLGTQKNRLNETVRLSTQNIC